MNPKLPKDLPGTGPISITFENNVLSVSRSYYEPLEWPRVKGLPVPANHKQTTTHTSRVFDITKDELNAALVKLGYQPIPP